jgi:hypothetical protein
VLVEHIYDAGHRPKHPEINMFISISLLSPRIRAMGEVVRSEALDSVKDKEGGHYGIGVRFIAISDIDLARIFHESVLNWVFL